MKLKERNKVAVFLDTGFILALKNKDDKNFTIAQTWMKRFLKNEFGKIYTSTFVFNELVTLALIRIKRADFAKNLGNYLLNSPRITLIGLMNEDFNKVWEYFQKYIEKRLSFTDCSILVHCERIDCNFLATFDSHFKELIATNLD
ncbi:MAG: PIN domain-containing protein [Promethearchaeota archaeon]|nr:MAG: PIN domain-containing protein [Candidatus Lokiarchaeota archaeon]